MMMLKKIPIWQIAGTYKPACTQMLNLINNYSVAVKIAQHNTYYVQKTHYSDKWIKKLSLIDVFQIKLQI